VTGQTAIDQEEFVAETEESQAEAVADTQEAALFEEVAGSAPEPESVTDEVVEEETADVPDDTEDDIAGFDLLTEISEEETTVTEEEEITIDIPMEEEDKDISEDLDFELDIEATIEEPVAPPVPEQPAVPEPPASTEDHKTILVIDDSLVIRKMVEIALEDEDFIIETAVSGKEGLDKLDSVNPALVILDMMLPDINGIEILKTIKASKGIPVIMLSGKDSPQMVENAKKEGAEEFLPKPFKDDDLVEKVKLLVK